MKSTIAALALLLGSSAAAQSARQELPEVPIIGSQPIQVEQMNAFGFETYSDSAVDAVTSSLSPGMQQPIPLAAFMRASNIANPRSSEFKKFGSDNFNRMLVANEFWARGLDAVSSHSKLANPCKCYREASRFFGVDMTAVFKSDAGAFSYSLGVAAAYSIISAKLWDASKNHPRHAKLLQRLSRSLLIGDSSMEIATDIHNFGLVNDEAQRK